ncbi:MAG: cellulase family glycosylhydrolase [Bacteroidetes bacterium]|nr:cellulase family glycosylhydrolase [Bacteroidota bacterium]
MKKCQNWIMLISMIFLFVTCRKEMRLNSKEISNSQFSLFAAGTAAYEWSFETSGDLEGWTAGNATPSVSGGALNLITTGTDPLIMSPGNLGISTPSAYKYIRINMKNSSSVTSARIFFTTNADTSWSQAKSKSFAIAANNQYYASYIIDMSTITGWAGTIRRIRIDPLDPATGSGQAVSIDYIAITQAIPNVREWYFDTTGHMEGWTYGNATAAVAGGTFNLTSTGTDPLMTSPDFLGITNPALYKFIHVDMKNNSAATGARIFFITDADSVWNQAKSKSFPIKANTNYYGSYIVDMSTVTGWTGTIRQIRVDPLDPSSAGQSVNIDFIRVTDNRSFRGVMSPQRGISSGDADTLKLWKVNVMRWQINDPQTTPAATADYENWLDDEIVELDQAFDLCEPLGIKILIDMHYTPGGHLSNGSYRIFYEQAANDEIVTAWQKLATHYKGRSGLYGYDLINEPQQWTATTDSLDYKATEARIGRAIRAIDPRTPIFVSTVQGNVPSNFSTFTPLPITNVIYEVHMYEPHEFTHQQLQAGDNKAVTYPGPVTNQANQTYYYDKSMLTTVLQPVRNFQLNYNARIFVGEFSAVRWGNGAATYLRDCMDLFEGYGWSWTYHAFRESTDWDLEFKNMPVRNPGSMRAPADTPTDRYNQVVGYGLNLNQ